MKDQSDKPLSPRQADRMARIIEVTKGILGEMGEDMLTIRHIASEAGVAPATIYNRFGSKDELISVALIEYFETRVTSRTVNDAYAGQSPLEQLMSMLQIMAKNSHERPQFTRTLTRIHYQAGEGSRVTDALFDRIAQEFLAIIEQLRASGDLENWVDPVLLAQEMRDVAFSVHAKACKDQAPAPSLYDHTLFSTLMLLRAGGREEFRQQIEKHIQLAQSKLIAERKF